MNAVKTANINKTRKGEVTLYSSSTISLDSVFKLTKMTSMASTNFLVFFTLVLLCMIGSSRSKCDFEAIFNFGDSNSDTGGFWAAFPSQSGPFGMTYFNKPVGRATDGRLIVDFLGN